MAFSMWWDSKAIAPCSPSQASKGQDCHEHANNREEFTEQLQRKPWRCRTGVHASLQHDLGGGYQNDVRVAPWPRYSTALYFPLTLTKSDCLIPLVACDVDDLILKRGRGIPGLIADGRRLHVRRRPPRPMCFASLCSSRYCWLTS